MNWLLSDVLPGRQRISQVFPAKSTGIVKHSPILDNFSCTCTSKSFHQKSIRCADKRLLLVYNTKNNHSLCELFKPTPNNISYLSSEACFTPPSVPSFFHVYHFEWCHQHVSLETVSKAESSLK